MSASNSSPREEEEDEVKVFNQVEEEEELDEVNELKKGLIDENEGKKGHSTSTASATASSSHASGSTGSSGSNSGSSLPSTSSASSLASSKFPSSFTPFSLGYFPAHPFPPANHSLETMMRSYPIFPELAPPLQPWRTASSMSPSVYPSLTHPSHPHHPAASHPAFHFSSAAAAAFARNTGQSLIPPYPPPPLAHTNLSHQQHAYLTAAAAASTARKSHHESIVAAMAATALHHPYSPLSHNSPLSYPSPLSSSHPTPPPHPSLFPSSPSMVASPSSVLPSETKPAVQSSLSHRVDSILNGSSHSSSSSSSSTSSTSSSRTENRPATSSQMNDQKNKAMNGHHVNHNNNRLNVMNQNHTSSSGGNNLSKNSLQQQQSQNNSKNGCNGSMIDMSHVKKPLNAFMLFMREQRSKVVAEHMLKESAAINQILGKMWHSLSRDDQQKYYDMARKAKSLHHQMYPGWTARDNYAINQKKKKKKRDKSVDGEPGSLKKCRARYGLDKQDEWCKPCRRKKKCIRYSEAEANSFNLGSVGSMDANTPDSKNESDAEKSIQDAVGDNHHLHHPHHLSAGRRPTDPLPLASSLALPHYPFYRSPI